jgi:hypothetical protein
MFRRALHEPRVIAALILVALAAPIGWYGKHDADMQASRDFARCGGAQPAVECVTKRLPVATSETESVSSGGYSHTYAISVQTGRNSYFSMNGLSRDVVQPFEGVSAADARFREGRLTAIVAPDGTALKVPLAFTTRLLVTALIAGAALLAGGGLLAWGFTRVNRRPA